MGKANASNGRNFGASNRRVGATFFFHQICGILMHIRRIYHFPSMLFLALNKRARARASRPSKRDRKENSVHMNKFPLCGSKFEYLNFKFAICCCHLLAGSLLTLRIPIFVVVSVLMQKRKRCTKGCRKIPSVAYAPPPHNNRVHRERFPISAQYRNVLDSFQWMYLCVIDRKSESIVSWKWDLISVLST